MLMTVKCECGEVFKMEISDKTYRSVGHYRESLMGKIHCPNPDCDKTVYAQANVYSVVELDENEQNPNVCWEEIEEGDRISYGGHPFEIVLKQVRKIKDEDDANLLFLRSLTLRDNLTLEVRESGFMQIFKEPGSWTEDDIELIKKNR